MNGIVLKNNGLFKSINRCYFINIHINILTDITIQSLNGLLSNSIESSTMMNVGISFNDLNIILYNNDDVNDNYYGLLTNSISNTISTEYAGLYVTGNKLKIRNNNNDQYHIGVLIGITKNVNLSYSFITLKTLNITNNNNNEDNNNNNRLITIGGLIGNSMNNRGELIYYRCFTLITNELYISSNNNNINVYYGNFIGSESIETSQSFVYNNQIYDCWIYCRIKYISQDVVYGNIIGSKMTDFEMFNSYIRVYNVIIKQQNEYNDNYHIPKIGLLFGSLENNNNDHIHTVIMFNNYISYTLSTDNSYNDFIPISEVYIYNNNNNNIEFYSQSVYILSNSISYIKSIYSITIIDSKEDNDIKRIVSKDNINGFDNNLLIFYNITDRIYGEVILYYNQMPYFDLTTVVDPSKSFVENIGIGFTLSSSTSSSISTINYVYNRIYIKSILSYYKESSLLLLPSPSSSSSSSSSSFNTEDGYINVNITIGDCYKINKQHQFTISSPDNNQFYYDNNIVIIIESKDCASKSGKNRNSIRSGRDINNNNNNESVVILNFISNNVVIETKKLVLYTIISDSNNDRSNDKTKNNSKSDKIKLIISYTIIGFISLILVCVILTILLLIRARIRDKRVVRRYDYKAKRRFIGKTNEMKDIKSTEERRSFANVKFEKLEDEKDTEEDEEEEEEKFSEDDEEVEID